MKIYFTAALALASLLFTRCSTDVDLIAPYKETTVVYGLLSPSDSVQFVRVAKAYLGEGNALTMAKVNDSIYYRDADIRVVLHRLQNDIIIDSTVLVRDESIAKEPGIFSNSPNVLYRTVYDPVNHSDSIYADSEYRIYILNKVTGKEITSTTGIVGDIIISLPSPNPNVKNLSMTSTYPNDIKWFSAINGKIYKVVMRFNYQEKLLADPFPVTFKSVDWTFPDIEARNASVSSELIIQYTGEDFYKNLALKMVPDNTVERKALTIDIIFSIGAPEFYTYYLVNQPSLTINQEIPQFTNITNGIGIFSSRRIRSLKNKELDIPSLDSLRSGIHTSHLGFI